MHPAATIKSGNLLGEGILWDDRRQRVMWTDIEGRAFHVYDWPRQTHHRYGLALRLCSFGLTADGACFIGAFETGFALFDPETGIKHKPVTPEGLAAGMRLNDGRVDCRGRFWAGAMVEQAGLPDAACLYSVQGGRIRTHKSGLGISNGICWSPDGSRFYFADSRRHVIWRHRFDPDSGAIGAPHEFARTPDSVFPDGSTVDAEGFIWNAQWGASRVVRYAPDGRIDRVLDMPVSQPSCVAFGGPGLDLLFVTSARIGLDAASASAQTGAGDVFVYNMDVAGLPENRFNLDGWPDNAASGGTP
jgi:L-arabinonolactonase